jgi:anthranilate synthase component 1
MVNPSPYMFFLKLDGFCLAGSSPETLIKGDRSRAAIRPIAGTRWRGATAEEDQRLGEELLADPKERAEHIMLVDLARNDLGRVCKPGTVRVDELMVIERYSHVMHIVSHVSGELQPGKDGFAVLKAAFPHGTVSGAPKIRAIQIIDELEPTARGPYAGAVGYFGFNGTFDLCITLRTITICNGMAYVQAGAGIVADSDPLMEYRETINKASAMIRAIELSEHGGE